MTIGLVAFLFGMAVFTAIYAALAPVHELPADDMGDPYSTYQPPAATPGAPASRFERWVRPAARNLLPRMPLSAVTRAQSDNNTIDLLIRSGNPWRIRPEEFLGIRVLAGVGGFFLGILAAVTDALPLPMPATLLVCSAIGYTYPKVILDRHKGQRVRAAKRGLPEALDLLVITLNAGTNFGPAVTKVVRRLPEGLIRTELAMVSADLRASKTIEQALTSFARRAPTDEVESFAKAVITAEQVGSHVSETLTAQAVAARTAYEADLDNRVGKLSQTLFFPILILMLPALLLAILAPAFASIALAF